VSRRGASAQILSPSVHLKGGEPVTRLSDTVGFSKILSPGRNHACLPFLSCVP
jgi:hypothetical protein